MVKLKSSIIIMDLQQLDKSFYLEFLELQKKELSSEISKEQIYTFYEKNHEVIDFYKNHLENNYNIKMER